LKLNEFKKKARSAEKNCIFSVCLNLLAGFEVELDEAEVEATVL
jgi:hypothetical protein